MRPRITVRSGRLRIERARDAPASLHRRNGESRISRPGKARRARLAGEEQPEYRRPHDNRKGTDMPLPQDIRPAFQDINWEVMEKLRTQPVPSVQAEAAE
jgi:hypothetical protein